MTLSRKDLASAGVRRGRRTSAARGAGRGGEASRTTAAARRRRYVISATIAETPEPGDWARMNPVFRGLIRISPAVLAIRSGSDSAVFATRGIIRPHANRHRPRRHQDRRHRARRQRRASACARGFPRRGATIGGTLVRDSAVSCATSSEHAGDAAASASAFPGTISPATGLVKNANSTWLIGQPLGRGSAAPARPAGAVRQRRQLLRAVGSDGRRGGRRSRRCSASSSAPARAAASSWTAVS